MNVLDEQVQVKILGLGHSSKDRYKELSVGYYKALDNKKYPRSEDLFIKWSYFKADHKDEFCILREFDEEGFYHLYSRLFNPVSLYIRKMPNGTYSFHLYIHSIDDSAYSFWFNNKTEQECNDLRNYFMEWFDDHKFIVISELLKECLNLGAINESY